LSRINAKLFLLSWLGIFFLKFSATEHTEVKTNVCSNGSTFQQISRWPLWPLFAPYR
jgi:hypothetical protein